MDRRSFVKHIGHSFAIPGVMSSFGFAMPGYNSMASLLKRAQETDKVLVMIYLQGGNDGLNTMVPLDQLSALNAVRPHVVLPENKLLELKGTDVGLHPSLGGFKSLYEEGRMQMIQSVGYSDPNFSHFRSNDIWMSASDSDKTVPSGWMGRYLTDEFPEYPNNFPNDEFPHPLAVEIGNKSSLLFQGRNAPMGLSIDDPTAFYELLDGTDEKETSTVLGEKLNYLRTVARQSQSYGKAVKEAAEKVTGQVAYPSSFLADQLKIVARLIAGGLQTSLYMVTLGGFDTHSRQVEDGDHSTGWHAGKLRELNDSVMAFVQDLEKHRLDEKVVGMTFSEFGRRIVSNASLGTDHGSAAPMFVFGNKVAGGQILGENPVISTSTSVNDNLDMQYDFRQVYASLMDQWLGASSEEVSKVLANDFDRLGIIGEGKVVTGINGSGNPSEDLLIYPNPINQETQIEFITLGGRVEITASGIDGKLVSKVFRGVMNPGKQIVRWNAGVIPAGTYVVHVKSEGRELQQLVIKMN